MSSHSTYAATGVLVLERVTPIITALFDGFHLNANYPGNGRAYIAFTGDGASQSWAHILGNLSSLGARRGILPREDPEPKTLLLAWAKHFHAEQDKELQGLIEYCLFEKEADLDPLFLLATRFDDGHKLTAIEAEGCWYCNKLRLFGFSGDTCFYSREFCLDNDTGSFLSLAGSLHETLRKQDLGEAAGLIALETWRLLEGIVDEHVRDTVHRRVIEYLTADFAS
jgi:hypothetical protein